MQQLVAGGSGNPRSGMPNNSPGQQGGGSPVPAQDEAPAPAAPLPAEQDDGRLKPFGHNLFLGNFLRSRHDGLNPDYIVKPGDRVTVQTWGAIQLNGVFVVDGQGNLFLPEIGPVPLGGVRNGDLTDVVKKHIKSVYVRHFGVYTNLLTARPISVFVTGGVRRPGSYAGLPSDSLLFFLDQAGGIDSDLGSYRDIEILRQGESLGSADLYNFLLDGELTSPQFRDGDTILIHRRGPVVTLQGDVATPALVELKEEQATGAQVLAVVPQNALANEVTWSGLRSLHPFQKTLVTTEFADVKLQNGDKVVLRNEGAAETILVYLDGAFEGPAVRSVRRGTRLIDLLNHVAVPSEISDPGAVHLRRMSVAKAQKDAIEDSLFRLERSALLALSSSNGEADIRVKEAELMQRFAERARLIDPLGRVVTSHNGVQSNMLLEDGDTIVIPKRTGVVRVSGEVQIAYASAHEDGMTAADYIKAAGGYTDRANEDHILLMHPNAEVEMTDASALVAPGDEILVPPRVDSKTLQNTMDVSQVIYQVAVAAGVVLGVVY